MATTEIPAALRQRAREEVQRRRQQQAVRTATTPAAAPPWAARALSLTAAPTPSYNPEDLYAMAVDAKLEITLKFSTLPNAQPAGQGKLAFALKTPDGQFVTAEVSSKVWNKLDKANTDWPQWVAALTGTMGPRTDRGFRLENSGLQVFEKKAKAVDSLAPAASAPAPAPCPPPPPTVPVTVTTGAGTADRHGHKARPPWA